MLTYFGIANCMSLPGSRQTGYCLLNSWFCTNLSLIIIHVSPVQINIKINSFLGQKEDLFERISVQIQLNWKNSHVKVLITFLQSYWSHLLTENLVIKKTCLNFFLKSLDFIFSWLMSLTSWLSTEQQLWQFDWLDSATGISSQW